MSSCPETLEQSFSFHFIFPFSAVNSAVSLPFELVSYDCGIPYQTLINLYLRDCAKNKRKLTLAWN